MRVLNSALVNHAQADPPLHCPRFIYRPRRYQRNQNRRHPHHRLHRSQRIESWLAIGILENLAGGYLDQIVGGGIKDVTPFAVLFLVLMIRPYGLFGTKEVERV